MELKPGPPRFSREAYGCPFNMWAKVALNHRTGFWPSTDVPPLQKRTESRQQLQSCHYGGFMSERKNKRAAKCFTALTTHTASLQPSDLSAPQTVEALSSPSVNAGGVVCCPMLHRVGFTAWLNANRHRHTQKTPDLWAEGPPQHCSLPPCPCIMHENM